MRSTLAVIDRAVLLNVSCAVRILRSQSTLKHDIAKTSTTSLNANITLIAYGLNKMAVVAKQGFPWSVGGAYLILFVLIASFPKILNDDFLAKRKWAASTLKLIRASSSE
jgi:multisubunit Na+/H+ antiporter MnhG subunit